MNHIILLEVICELTLIWIQSPGFVVVWTAHPFAEKTWFDSFGTVATLFVSKNQDEKDYHMKKEIGVGEKTTQTWTKNWGKNILKKTKKRKRRINKNKQNKKTKRTKNK